MATRVTVPMHLWGRINTLIADVRRMEPPLSYLGSESDRLYLDIERAMLALEVLPHEPEVADALRVYNAALTSALRESLTVMDRTPMVGWERWEKAKQAARVALGDIDPPSTSEKEAGHG